MTCNPISIYINTTCKAPVVGVGQLYLVAYHNLNTINGEVYTVGSNGMVNDIHFDSELTKFVKIGLMPKSASMKDNYIYNEVNGVSEFNEELNFPIANITNTSRKIMKILRQQPVVALIKFSTGVWFILGLDGQMYLSNGEGLVNGNSNGYNITLSGVANDFALIVDPTIISNIVMEGNPPARPSSIFTRIFNRIFR